HHFRRQATIGPYFADFASHQLRIIIEIDGGQHFGSSADDRRTSFLHAEGYRVLRFWNNDVLPKTSGVLVAIDTAINAATPPTPDPSPPQAGGGEESKCPTFSSNSFPKKFPRACRRKRRMICSAWSPTGWSPKG